MTDIIYNPRFKPTKYQDTVRFNGIKLQEFFARAEYGRGAESYVKYFMMIVDWDKKLSSSGKPFFVSRKRMMETLNTKKEGKKVTGYGNDYCKKTFERAEKWLAELEIIEVVKTTKAERLASKEELHKKEQRLNRELADKLLSIYESDDPFIRDHAYQCALKQVMKLVDKKKILEEEAGEVVIKTAELYMSRLKKIILKRPISDVKGAKEKYEEYKRLGLSKGKYNNENEMLVYFIYHRTGKYYNVKNFFKNHIPTYLQDQQKVADDAYMPNVIPILERRALEEIMRANVKEKGKLIAKRYGYQIPITMIADAKAACIWFDNKLIIRGYDVLAEGRKQFNE